MKEKEIIRAEEYDIKKIRNIIWIIGGIITFLWFFIYVIPGIQSLTSYGYSVGSFVGFHLCVPFLPFFVVGLVFYLGASKIELIVTDKRVYGVAIFDRRVDLPLDMISAVSTSIFKGIAISTPSGLIKFIMIKNRDEIHKVISELLVKRQDNNLKNNISIAASSISEADEIAKYKKLLDSKAITQEEYDKKKKELLK